MIDVSGEAIRELKVRYPAGEQGSIVRIVLAGRGCGGPIFELEPSSPTERDEIREEDRLTIVADKRLVEEFKAIVSATCGPTGEVVASRSNPR